MTRALRIDLRRSSAVGIGLLLLALGLIALLVMTDAEWYVGRWTRMVLTTRDLLLLLWPLTLAAGAWQVGRDRRGRVGELFASTGRPAWQRVAPPAVALVVTVSAAFVLLTAAGAAKVLPTARYFNPDAVSIAAVGLVALIAAALLGMAVGRLLPSPFTAPVLAIVGLGVTTGPSLRPLSAGEGHGLAFEFLSPALSPASSDFVTVPWRVNATQGIWMVAIAVTGYLLLAAAGRRQRLIAALPVVLGAAIVIPMLPHGEWYQASYVADPGSQALVCADGAPRVCVRQVHAALLPEVVGPARLALQRLSRLPDPPTSAVEFLDVDNPLGDATSDPTTVGFGAWMNGQGRLSDPAGLEVELVDVGAGSHCPGHGYDPHNVAARRAAGWALIGRTPAPSGDPEADPLIADAYRKVSALPEKQRLERVTATRAAYRTCAGDPYAILTGDAK
jgi:hypothetical protein